MVFCSCEKRFRLDAALSPWAFSLYLISGSSLKSYAGLLSKDQEPVVMDVPPFSDTALHLQKLPSAISSDQSSLLSHALLTDILVAGIIRHANQDPQPLLPSYLAEARILFDHHFEENYSLDELAMRFHVSKYRFCREFVLPLAETPLQYLNQKRIKVAKHLLLTTSLKIHEVGSAVGIDNTNHFISLFKKYTGLTPLVYRQTRHDTLNSFDTAFDHHMSVYYSDPLLIAFPVHLFDQGIDRFSCHLLDIYFIGRDLHIADPWMDKIIKSRQRKYPPVPGSLFLKHIDQNPRCQIAVADKCCRHLLWKSELKIITSLSIRKIPVLDHPVLSHLLSMLKKCFCITKIAVCDASRIKKRSHIGNIFMPHLKQIIRHLVHSVKIICHHAVTVMSLIIKIQKSIGTCASRINIFR